MVVPTLLCRVSHVANHVCIGLRQFNRALWKPFKVQFPDLENRLRAQSDAIDRELAIASETAALRDRQAAVLYRTEGIRHRAIESKHRVESQEWRLQQDFKEKGEGTHTGM